MPEIRTRESHPYEEVEVRDHDMDFSLGIRPSGFVEDDANEEVAPELEFLFETKSGFPDLHLWFFLSEEETEALIAALSSTLRQARELAVAHGWSGVKGERTVRTPVSLDEIKEARRRHGLPPLP